MSESRCKKLLLLSYYWPPLGGPGAIRPVKFAKYLPFFDYEPVVITRKSIVYHSYDDFLINDVKNIFTVRTETLDPARLLWLAGMRVYRPKKWQRTVKSGLNFPDHKIFWMPFAYQTGMKLDCDFIMVTAPPFSAFIAGHMISHRTGKPLILDFRDAWVEFPFLPYRGVQKEFAAYLEKKIIEQAALIIVVDDNIKDLLARKYRHIKHKLHVIPNGYDPCDFNVTEYPAKFTFSYLGTIRIERDPRNFLRAVSELINADKIKPTEIEVKFIGHIEEEYRRMIQQYSFTRILGHKPYVAALSDFSAAHAALLVTTGNEFFFPSRQNEYLASGLPIIISGRSKGIHLLSDAFANGYPGWSYDFNDIDGMKTKILELYHDWQNKRLPRGHTPYTEFTREKLTGKLASLIRNIKVH